VTLAEAANHLGLSHYEDLDEAVEMNLFQCRQELIQKADQVLLFPAKEKRLKLLQLAAETLGFTFDQALESQGILEIPSTLIEERFQYFQANRSRLLKEVGQIASFLGLVLIQQQLNRNYLIWASFWNDLRTLNSQEVKLSTILDSMRFLQVIQDWKEKRIEEIQQLDSTNIPSDIQVEILRLQQVSAKLS
jgi:hypothetical protein